MPEHDSFKVIAYAINSKIRHEWRRINRRPSVLHKRTKRISAFVPNLQNSEALKLSLDGYEAISCHHMRRKQLLYPLIFMKSQKTK